MASRGSRPGTATVGGPECGCPQLRQGCAGWFQARGCCVAAYEAGWVLLGRGVPAAAEVPRHEGGCPRFADRPEWATGAVAARTSRLVRPPSWLSSGGRPV